MSENQAAASEPKPRDKDLSLLERLLAISTEIGVLVKGDFNQQQGFKFVSSVDVLMPIREAMNYHGVLLTCNVEKTELGEKVNKSGSVQLLCNIWYEFVFINVDKPDDKIGLNWFAQGIDSAEKGPGKAATYAEKSFLLKQFHIPTPADDPDNDPKPAAAGRFARNGADDKPKQKMITDQQRKEIWTAAQAAWPDVDTTAKRDRIAAECQTAGIPDDVKKMTEEQGAQLLKIIRGKEML